MMTFIPRSFRPASMRNRPLVFQRLTISRSGLRLQPPIAIVSRRYQTSDASQATSDRKPYYVTTPIFYVNAEPHVGHLYSSVLGDVIKRWEQLKGNKALLLTGTDEYGMKIQRAAAKARSDPKSFCDGNAESFQRLAKAANIKYDRFIRTTDPDHKQAVEHFWRILRENGYIDLKKHSGWYSVSDEAFYPETAIEQIIHPPTGELIVVSKETGKVVEWMEEENYHFKLSQMGPELLKFYEANPDWIIPHARHEFIVNEVSRGLEDLSISRPSERLKWGIPVPGDPSHTVYVWLDALINYITFTGYPWTPGAQSAWPADVHIVGKDIIRFHCIYWPAFLLAIGAPLPKHILSHAHWTMSKKKMSKSVGNVVDPFHAMTRYGVDPIRFYLCHDGGILNDGDYSSEEIENKYTKSLGSQVGSLLTRVCSGKYSVEDAVRTEKEQETVDLGDLEPLYKAMRTQVLNGLRDRVTEKMDKYDLSGGLKEILSAVAETHKYIHSAALWEESKANVRSVMLYPAADVLRISGILLQPFMPEKMELLLNLLKVDPNMRTWEHAVVGADFSYGVGTSGEKTRVFPRPYMREGSL